MIIFPQLNSSRIMTNRYTEYYRAQLGGNIPVFRGGLQRGAGLGDVLRGIFRWFAPVAARGVSTFANNAINNATSGMPLLQAARKAVAPAISAAAGAAGPHVQGIVENLLPVFGFGGRQKGSGGVLFSGEEGIPTGQATINAYKRSLPTGPPVVKPKRQKGVKPSKSSFVHYNF